MQSTVHVIANWANVRLRVQDFELAQIVSENQTKKYQATLNSTSVGTNGLSFQV